MSGVGVVGVGSDGFVNCGADATALQLEQITSKIDVPFQ
jgi:hypothetical protein